MSDGCLQCCRWCCCVFLVLFNILEGLLGLVFLLFGIALLWGHAVVSNLTQSALKDISDSLKDTLGSDFDFQSLYSSISQMAGTAGAIFLVLGIVFIIVSCIGCCGACCAVPACLIFYAVAVSLIFLAQIIMVIIWFADKDLMKRSVRTSLEKQVEQFKGFRSGNMESLALNVIQMAFGCCGVVNGSDFQRASPMWNRTFTMRDSSANAARTFNLTYPVTCCKFDSSMKMLDQYCPYNGTDAVSNVGVGCYKRVFETIESHFRINNFFFGVIGWAGIELLLILGAILIYCAARRQQQPQHRNDVQYKMQPMA